MSSKKKRPEFELGPLLINQVQEYLGQRTINKLSSTQATSIARFCNDAASLIGAAVSDETPPGPITRGSET